MSLTAHRGAFLGRVAKLSASRLRARRLFRTFAWPILFLSPWLVGLFGLIVLPMGLSLYYSFTNFNIIRPPIGIGTSNYTQLFSDPTFIQSTENQLYLVVVMVPLGLLAALLFAVLLNQPVRGIRVFRTALFLPSLVPPVAGSLLWMWMLNPEYGLVNSALALFHITGPLWLFSVHWSKPALVLMQIWSSGGAMIIFLAGLQGVPRSQLEAALLDGARAWQRFRHVTLPAISPVLLFNMIMGILAALQYFTQAYIMGSGSTGTAGVAGSLEFYTVYLFQLAFGNLEMGYASAMAWLMFIIAGCITTLLFLSAKYWVHYEGWK